MAIGESGLFGSDNDVRPGKRLSAVGGDKHGDDAVILVATACTDVRLDVDHRCDRRFRAGLSIGLVAAIVGRHFDSPHLISESPGVDRAGVWRFIIVASDFAIQPREFGGKIRIEFVALR